MREYTFENVHKEVMLWYDKYFRNDDKCVQIVRKDEFLSVDLVFNYCVAQITVSNQSYVPYKYLSFEVVTLDSKVAMESGQPELIYCFYDDENSTIEAVKEKLDEGVEICLNYSPF